MDSLRIVEKSVTITMSIDEIVDMGKILFRKKEDGRLSPETDLTDKIALRIMMSIAPGWVSSKLDGK